MDFQEADSQCSPWPTVSLSFLSSFPSVQILKTPFPLTKPSLQYTSSNKEIGNVCFLSCLFLCFFGAYSSFTAMSWKWIMVSRCLDGPYSPQRDVTHHLDWWWQWWRWCCWWRQWWWWCWWSSAINCILWSDKDFGLPKLIWNGFYTWSNPNLSVYSILIIVSVLSI